MRTDQTPSVNVSSLVRAARGPRRGPRGVRDIPSTAPLRYAATLRGAIGGRTVWAIRAEFATYGGDRGELVLDFVADGVPCRPAVELRSEPARFGGVRWFAVCPECGGSCVRVWLRGTEPRCRRCAGVAWSSWSERDGDRATRALLRLRWHFRAYQGHEPEDDEGDLWSLPPKPPAMKWRTYAELEARHHEALVRQLRAFRAVSARLGHKDPAMTLRIYSHVMPLDDAALAARVAAILG